MSRAARRATASVLLQLAAIGLNAATVLGTDDYTLPFYNPAVTLSYGVDRDAALGRQLDWTGQVWNDGLTHYGRVYDQHTGVDYPMALRSEVAAAKDGTVVDLEGGFGTSQFGAFGNFVKVQHADGRQTLYYHLASAADGGIAVGAGAGVVAGQRIGRSGCSGNCNGPHLHFELLVWNSSSQAFKPADPLAERRRVAKRKRLRRHAADHFKKRETARVVVRRHGSRQRAAIRPGYLDRLRLDDEIADREHVTVAHDRAAAAPLQAERLGAACIFLNLRADPDDRVQRFRGLVLGERGCGNEGKHKKESTHDRPPFA